MNLRKTIAGAAVALGSATVMLGLGGTANAAVGADAQTQPDLGGQLGDVASAGQLASVNTHNEHGKIEAINGDEVDVKALLENVDAGGNGVPAATLLGLNEPQGPANVVAGAGI